MTVSVPRLEVGQTSISTRGVFLGLAALRAVVAGLAVLAAPWLYREHAAVLVLLRPTKEVFLFSGFLALEGDVALPVVLLAALPLLLAGVWLFYGLGGAYAKDLEQGDLPGIAGRILPKKRLDQLCGVLDEKGMRVVFLGRLAAFPSSLMAAAAGASGVPWKRFVVADTAGALVSMGAAVGLGYALGETYDEVGIWLTGAGILVLVVIAVVVGRSLSSSHSSS